MFENCCGDKPSNFVVHHTDRLVFRFCSKLLFSSFDDLNGFRAVGGSSATWKMPLILRPKQPAVLYVNSVIKSVRMHTA